MEARRTNRVIVLGARGVLGALTVRAFAAAGWAVRSAARRPHEGDVEIDLERRDSIAAALDDQELVVNTVPHPDLLAERYVLEHGGTLINVSALPAAAGRSLRAVAAGARGTVLMNAGLAPGVTTVVGGDLLRVHPDAEELEIVFTLSGGAPRGQASADFVRRGLTHMARHRTRLVPLPRPIGERICIGFGEGDSGWLGGIAEGRIVRLFLCITEPAMHEGLLELNSAGAMNNLPRSLIGSRNAPADGTASQEPVAHWIAAIRGGRRLSARTVECRGDFLHAARSTVAFADALLADGPRGGCFDPEEIFTLEGIEAELRDLGINVVARNSRAHER